MTAAAITSDALRSELAQFTPGSTTDAATVAARSQQVLRPAGALAQLDDLAIWIAHWQQTSSPAVSAPIGLVFAADHGVAVEHVSAYPAEITAAMLAAVRAGQASICAIADAVGATVIAIDVGVGDPTGNLRIEPALTTQRFAAAFEAGRSAVRNCEADLLVLGELGIGNTTAAAAVTAALLGEAGGAVDAYVGRGTGIGDAVWVNKRDVVRDAVQRIDGVSDPLEVLRQVGGAELVAMAGAMVQARADSIPLVLDGYIATAPALALSMISPDLVANIRAGHRSAEPGHRIALARLGLEPLLTMDFRLGEGSGAMAVVPLVALACRAVTHVATFEEFSRSYTRGDAAAD